MQHLRQLVLLLFAILSLTAVSPAAAQDADETPRRNDFAQLVSRLSEPGGDFASDNLISNELSYQHVLGKLNQMNVGGGAYLGVGPDQNFTYLAQLKPRIAIMLDIRRDAMLQHLFFKALFMMSRNRIEYLSLLFGRPLPKDFKKWNEKPIRDLVAYFDRTPLNHKAADKTKGELHRRLATFGVPLSQRDLETIDAIQRAFYTDCLEVRYTIRDRPNGLFFPAYRDLLLEKDLDGNHRNYLANEVNFQVIKSMHDRNLIIPVTADLSGAKALKAIGEFLREINEKVSAFYVSNVEFYLWQQDGMQGYIENLKSLPINGSSVIIRSYFNYAYYTHLHPQTIDNYFSVQLLQTIESLIKDYDQGGYASYYELTTRRSLDLK